jgi:hypothetical protein
MRCSLDARLGEGASIRSPGGTFGTLDCNTFNNSGRGASIHRSQRAYDAEGREAREYDV